MVDANHNVDPLPVRSFVFLGAPHRGLEITALKTLVQGTSSESMISELKEGSSVLEILDHDFEKYYRGSTVQILTCYESYPTPTVKMVGLDLAHVLLALADFNRKSSDGSWKRDGDRVMMVTKAHAHLGYEDNEIGVYADHSKIAKIDISTTGPFLSIKQAIDRALLGNSEQRGSAGNLGVHPSSDARLQRSSSAAALLGKDERPTPGLMSGHAEQRSPSTPPDVLGRSKSTDATPKSTSSVPTTAAKSSRRWSERIGEDLPINRAIYDGNVVEVRKLSAGALLDKPDTQGYTPLMVAAANNQRQVIDDLIARGASLKFSGPKGDTAFHLACKYAGFVVVSMFLKYAELLEIRGSEGRTPLMSSILNPREWVARLLLESTGNVESFDGDGKTALHYAAISGKTEVARLLIINRGANKDSKTRSGWTPIHCAAHRWHPKVVDLLGMNGADCKASTSKEDGARSAIHLVLLKPGRTRCITLLIRYGADLEQPDGAGNTPLHWAAQHGAPDSIEWLISKKANLEARTSDSKQRTPLHIAAQAGRLDIAKILLNAGADNEAAMKPPSGRTALHIATEENNIDLVKELLARKANVDPIYKFDPIADAILAMMGGSSDMTPLMMATEKEHLEIMKLLLKAGADVEGKNPSSESRPLFIAVKKGNLAAVRKLLDYNAAAETKGSSTPLTEATEAGNIPIMKELLAKDVRADVERTNSKGYPCLFIAASMGHVDAVELLLDHEVDPYRGVVVKKFLSAKKIKKAGEYFESNVSEGNRRRIARILSEHRKSFE